MPRDGRRPDAHCPRILPDASHPVSLFGKYGWDVQCIVHCELSKTVKVFLTYIINKSTVFEQK